MRRLRIFCGVAGEKSPFAQLIITTTTVSMSKVCGQLISIFRAGSIVCTALAGLFVTCVTREVLAEGECSYLSQSSADSVYDQALSTVRTLTQESLKARRSGAWRPDGSFAQPFLNRAGRSLREIRALLIEASANGSAVSRAALLEAFDEIFEVSFPRGLRHLARLERVERRKFVAVIDELPSIAGECAG